MNDFAKFSILAEQAYVAYGETTGGKNYQGLPMPVFSALTETIRYAWVAAVKRCTVHIGKRVWIHSPEGFGGPGRVVAVRDEPTGHWQIRLEDGSQPDFWAHDFEIAGIDLRS